MVLFSVIRAQEERQLSSMVGKWGTPMGAGLRDAPTHFTVI